MLYFVALVSLLLCVNLMRFQILSDLHIDTYARKRGAFGIIPNTNADMILVAGDTANSDSGMSWLQQQAANIAKPIVTIAGNHEYFSEDILTFDKKLANWDNFDANTYTGLRVLQCSGIDIEDVRILGCTLWTDYQYQASEKTRELVMSFMRDYKQIRAGTGLFSPEISVKIHQQHRSWLLQALKETYQLGKKAVVMTHHSISPLSVSTKYDGMPTNAAFISDLSSWMYEDWAPCLWVHGHTHEAFDYNIGNTRVVVNPRAYPGEVSSTQLQFNWSKVVEV